MNQWDVYMYDFGGEIGPHPAIVISNKYACARGSKVNVLKCVTKRGDATAIHVVLNGADGLDHETLCACDFQYLANKADLKQLVGTVSPVRRQAIIKKIIALLNPP